MPIGINIPNYDAIRTKIGYKNVSLTNVMAARTGSPSTMQYCPEANKLRIYGQDKVANDIGTSLHELFGHGSGRMIDEATFNTLTEE